MKIPNYLNVKINDAYLQQTRTTRRNSGNDTRATSESRKAKRDEIVLSPRVTEIRELEGAAKAVFEVRQGKVEAIEGQIASDTYNVNGKLVAQSIADLLSNLDACYCSERYRLPLSGMEDSIFGV